MIIIGYILQGINYIIWIYSLLLVINAIMSWLPFLANSVVGRFLDKIVNPYLNLFRRGPIAQLAYRTGIDISPVIGIFILYFVQSYVLQWIANIILRLVG